MYIAEDHITKICVVQGKSFIELSRSGRLLVVRDTLKGTQASVTFFDCPQELENKNLLLKAYYNLTQDLEQSS